MSKRHGKPRALPSGASLRPPSGDSLRNAHPRHRGWGGGAASPRSRYPASARQSRHPAHPGRQPPRAPHRCAPQSLSGGCRLISCGGSGGGMGVPGSGRARPPPGGCGAGQGGCEWVQGAPRDRAGEVARAQRPSAHFSRPKTPVSARAGNRGGATRRGQSQALQGLHTLQDGGRDRQARCAQGGGGMGVRWRVIGAGCCLPRFTHGAGERGASRCHGWAGRGAGRSSVRVGITCRWIGWWGQRGLAPHAVQQHRGCVCVCEEDEEGEEQATRRAPPPRRSTRGRRPPARSTRLWRHCRGGRRV